METTKRFKIVSIQHRLLEFKLDKLKENFLFIQYLITSSHLLDNTSIDDIREIEDHADNTVADSGKFQIKLLEFEFPYFNQTFNEISFYYDNVKRLIRKIKMHKITNVHALHCSDLRQYHLKPFSGVNRVHSDNVYQFFMHINNYFERRKTLPEMRAIVLAKFLRGSAKEAFERLSKIEQDDFSRTQNILIKIFGNQHKLIRCYERFQSFSIGPIPTAIGDNIDHSDILRKAKGHMKLHMKYEAIFAFHQQTIPTSIIFNCAQYLQPENKSPCNNIKDIMQAVQITITNAEQALVYSP